MLTDPEEENTAALPELDESQLQELAENKRVGTAAIYYASDNTINSTRYPYYAYMQTLLNEGVSTLVVQTEKGSTTLNLSLLVEGQKGTDRVVLRLSLIHILLDIVGGTGGDGSEHHFLGGASAGKGGDCLLYTSRCV